MTVTSAVNKYGVEVGDLFACHWGYDQSNWNFYRVVRVTATKAEVTPVKRVLVESDGPNDKVTGGHEPAEYDVLVGIGREDTKRTKLCTVKTGYKGQPTLVLRSGQYWANKVDEGATFHETGYGWGH